MDVASLARQTDFVDRFTRLCQDRIAPRAHEVDRTATMHTLNLKDLVDIGYFALFHPKTLGGLEADPATLCACMEALAKACPSTYWLASVSTVLSGRLIFSTGTPEQHQRFLLPIVKGERIGAFAAAETGPGGDQSSYQTTLGKNASGYVLNGYKIRVTNATIAEVAVVVARNVPTASEPDRNLRFCMVDLRHKGVKRFSVPATGMRGCPWGGITFDNVPVAPEDILKAGFESVLDAAAWGQASVAFMGVGMAEAALEASLEFCGSRHAFGQAQGHLPDVQRLLGSMRTQINACRALACRAVYARQNKQPPSLDLTKMAKICATDLALRCCDMAFQIHGSWGCTKHFVIERLYRDALTTYHAAVSNGLLADIVACGMVEQDPYKHAPCDWLVPAGMPMERPAPSMPGPTAHTRMYADPHATPLSWGPMDRSLVTRTFGHGISSRSLDVPDQAWESLGALASDMGTDRQGLINQAIHSLLRTSWPFGGGGDK